MTLIVETQQQVQTTTAQQVNEETQAIAQTQQARVTKNPRKVAPGGKAKLIHNSNIEHSTIKTWAPYILGVVAIAVVWLFYKTGEEKTSPASQVQLELSPHVVLLKHDNSSYRR